MVLETAATITTAKVIKSLIEKLVTPQIEKFAKECGHAYNDLLIPKGEHFKDYLTRTYDKYSSINTLVNPNSQFQLKDIYVTQTLVKDDYYERYSESTIIDSLPVSLIKKYKKILIKDTAGMGKSTIMKLMFIDLIDQGLDQVGIPIYLELNRLNKNRTILKEIQEDLSSLSEGFNHNMLSRFIQNGGFIFFLDGYDEISIADKNFVTKDIKDFISKAGKENFFILASRPEDSLASFGNFQSFKIQPLTKNDAFELLTKYDTSKQKIKSKKLIKELKTEKYVTIDEYLVNPLLVSLLMIAFNYKAEIPLKKHQFYRQVYDALFNSHKLAQGQKPHEKHSGLDIDDFNRVLRFVGFDCLKSIGVRFDKDTILKSISTAKEYGGNLKFSESDFLKDLLITVPLFSKDGTEFKWAHKSLMEYFAANFIFCDAKQNQDEILTAIYNSNCIEDYINMLDIYFDIDYKGFSKNITLPFCKSYLQFYNDHHVDLNINRELVEDRISLLFLYNYYCGPIKKKAESFKFSFGGRTGFSINKGRIKNNLNEQIYFFIESKINPRLIQLLYEKERSIFKNQTYSYKKNQIRNGIDMNYHINIIYNYLDPNKLCLVDIKTGVVNEKVYNSINVVFNFHSRWALDYTACKKETDRINKEIKHSYNKSFFTNGI